jgi:hypothetical protein
METPTAKVCPHCQLPPVLPEVCTPEIHAVIEASIARDTALHHDGFDLGKRMAGDPHPTPPPAALAPEQAVVRTPEAPGRTLRKSNESPARAEAPEGARVYVGELSHDYQDEHSPRRDSFVPLADYRAEVSRLTEALEQATRERGSSRALVREICEEWNEKCDEACDSYGHADSRPGRS